jgi:hypothetical protein
MQANQKQRSKWIIVGVVVVGLWWFYSFGPQQAAIQSTAVALPTPTHPCNPETVIKSLDELDAAYQAWDDDAQLVVDAWKAAGFTASSSAVVTAMSQLSTSDRVVERVHTPECITQAHYSLFAYTHAVTRDFRGCIFENECGDLEHSGSEEWTDYQAHRSFAVCLIDDPEPGSSCSYPFYANTYNANGTFRLTPNEQATVEALAAPYRTKAAMTAEP